MFTSYSETQPANPQKMPCKLLFVALFIYVSVTLFISHLNEIIICQAAPQSSAPNRLVLLEHNNDTVLSFASSEAAAVAMDAILQNQLLALSLCEENPASPRWRQMYAVKSFSLQVCA